MIKRPDRFDDYEILHLNEEATLTYSESSKGTDKEKWKQAIKEEKEEKQDMESKSLSGCWKRNSDKQMDF